jgi:hypothetical protein
MHFQSPIIKEDMNFKVSPYERNGIVLFGLVWFLGDDKVKGKGKLVPAL